MRGLASGYRAGAICNRDCRGAVVAELDGEKERAKENTYGEDVDRCLHNDIKELPLP